MPTGLDGKSLAVLTPMYGGMAMCNYVESFIKLMLLAQREKLPFSYAFTYNESLITRARNRLTDEFMKNMSATHAIFIDADIGFEPEQVFQMLVQDKDIAGAPCSKKSLRWDRVVRMIQRNGQTYSADDLSRVAGDFVFNYERFEGKKDIKINEPQEVRNVGTGLMMVRRNVFEKFQEAYPDRWYESLGDPSTLPGPVHDYFRAGINPKMRTYDSEDYCFCQDAAAIGFKVFMIPWITTSHMGSYKFIGDMPAVARLAGEL